MSTVVPNFYSTRSKEPAVSFGEALLKGLAPDGGLYVPDQVPPLAPVVWRSASSFQMLATEVLLPWLQNDIAPEAAAHNIQEALNFPVPLVSLGETNSAYEGVHVLELFHGPTLSFKDFGARTMARLMGHLLKQRSESLTILVATSGDTGSAVADGFAGQENINVVLLYPKGQVSDVQERQLIVERPGVEVFAVDGTFDDCQRMVKAAFVDEALAECNLSSANSINIGRLLPQMLYYIWTVAELEGEAPYFCVPSGNLGNLTGGAMAHLGGLPVKRFLAAHNANDFFPRYLAGETKDFKPSVRTLSNAMDVGTPSNFERLEHFWDNEQLQQRIWGTSVTDAATRKRMQKVYDDTGYVACPHTSVGLEAAARFRAQTTDNAPVVVLSTAHPAKFPDTVAETLQVEPPRADALEKLKERPSQYEVIAPTDKALRERLLAQAVS